MDKTQLDKILKDHSLWLQGKGGAMADLLGAYLQRADLRGAGLYGADLRGADLRWVNLYGADLRWVNLYGADLRGANLREANLREANLRGANLREANLPKFQITPKGYPMIGFKKLIGDTVCVLEIPAEAERTASLVGRKCRAEYAKVISGSGASSRGGDYVEGQTVYPDKYDGDIRVECTSGIHFFQTYEEAKEY